MNYVIASSRVWYEGICRRLGAGTSSNFFLLREKRELEPDSLAELKPRYIFFPHWSYLIPEAIYDNFECVIFHMTDVPFGRGGSPLQNLIARGIYETQVTALRCGAELDAGPVYLKHPLSLHGTAEEIYLRAAKTIEAMIREMIENEPEPVPQQGEVVTYARRKPEESDISQLTELEKAFDYIRMLDADGYPRAFLETEHFRIEFQRPSMKQGRVLADVVITEKAKK